MGDGVTLRQSHFQLGNDPNAYQTTSMAQSDGIENIGPCKTSLDENVKNELRKSHFVIGNFDPEYNTKYRSEYYDKSHMIPKDGIDTAVVIHSRCYVDYLYRRKVGKIHRILPTCLMYWIFCRRVYTYEMCLSSLLKDKDV